MDSYPLWQHPLGSAGRIDEGFHNPYVAALALTGPGRLLAGSSGNGVFLMPACADEQDDDGDGAVDWDGGPAQGTPDPQCPTPTRNREAPGCESATNGSSS